MLGPLGNPMLLDQYQELGVGGEVKEGGKEREREPEPGRKWEYSWLAETDD